MGKPVHVPEPEAGIPFVDTHCHVTDRNFKGSLPPPARQLADYRAAGGQFIVVCSIDVESAMDSLAFARENEGVHFSCGWAPQNIAHAPIDKEKKEFARWRAFLDEHLDSIVAFGEIGLDFHHAKTLEKRNLQIAELDEILSIVATKDKPIVLHVRNAAPGDVDKAHPDHAYNKPDSAAREVLRLLGAHGIPSSRVLFHCYSGPSSINVELAREGFWFSVPSSAFGIEKWNKVSRGLPIDRLVTETDAPFQHPTSMEPINTPANARHAVAAIASARGLPQAEAGRKTVENARKFFGILP